MNPTKILHILCFGDSITAGGAFIDGNLHFFPYSKTVQSSLQEAFPSANVTVDVQGLPGDQVVTPPGHYLTRMNELYSKAHSQTPYSHAVILGGTNDIAQNSSAANIYEGLKKVWEIPLKHDTSVLALTVTELPAAIDVEWQKPREKLNKAILGHKGGKKFNTLDLAVKMPWTEMSEEDREEIWLDGVHFTAKGYGLMGKFIAEALVKIIAKEKGWKIEKNVVVQERKSNKEN